MRVQTHPDVAAFFETAQEALELNEAANSIILGVGGQLVRYPERYAAQPVLKTVADERGLVLAAMMTPPHKLLVYAHEGDLEGAARLLVEDLVDGGVPVPGVLAPTDTALLVAAVWAAVTGVTTAVTRRQQAFALRRVLVPKPERGALRQATRANLALVARWWYQFDMDVFDRGDRDGARHAAEVRIQAGNIYLWEDVWPVSMAMTVRPTRNGTNIGGVYTPPELRNRGYATACVGELSRLLLAPGCSYCGLFADVENAAANRVYRRIGYRPLCEYVDIAFGDR